VEGEAVRHLDPNEGYVPSRVPRERYEAVCDRLDEARELLEAALAAIPDNTFTQDTIQDIQAFLRGE
jgi:hypothetical protein